MKPRRRRPRRRAPRRTVPLYARLARARAGSSRWRLLIRGLLTWQRILLGALLLVVLVLPVPAPASSGSQGAAGCHSCRSLPPTAKRWSAALAGTWTAGTAAGTEPAYGQAYVAIGGGLAVVGNGLTLTGYASADGKKRWQVVLTAPAGSVIMSVRAWTGVVTVGLLAPGGRSRTEAVIDAATGRDLRRYPAAVFGGAVAASRTGTVIVGPSSVTDYDNATGRPRWQHATAASQSWQVDGANLYVAQYKDGTPGASKVTALKVINLNTGAQRLLGSPVGHPFTGSLAAAAGGAVLFASASGVTAYGATTGGALWSRPASVPEGIDPAAHLVYLAAADGTLTGVDPGSGLVRERVSSATVAGWTGAGSAGMYAVRGGIALGLQDGANGQAWGYSVAAGQLAWTSAALPWPHFFADVSGLGGSAAAEGDLVAVTACPRLAETTGAAGSSGSSGSPGLCATPELVAFALLLPHRPGKSGL